MTSQAASLLTSRHDYLPFGEEVYANTGSRTTIQGYTAAGYNPIDKARYDSSAQGRFTSADSFGGSAGNPQSLNRYAYVGNNPMNFSDPTGHDGFSPAFNGFDASIGGQGSNQYPESPAEVAQDSAAYDQRLQNTRDAIAANDAQAHGNLHKRDEIMDGNSSLEFAGSGSSVTASAQVTGPSATVSLTDSALGAPQGGAAQGAAQGGQPEAQQGTLILNSQDAAVNCMAWAFGHNDRWMQPGSDGHSIETTMRDGSVSVVNTSTPVTPGNLPGFLGGKWIHANQGCPRNTIKLKVYEDSARPYGWHVERKDYGSRTWTSKNGQSFRYHNIRNPDTFYRQQYHPAGTVTITAWCVPAH